MMRGLPRKVLGALLALLSAGSTAASGGDADPLRVRILAPAVSTKPIVGRLLASDDSKVTVRSSGDDKSVVVPRASIVRLDHSVRSGRRGLGAKIGALVGFAVGIGAGAAYCSGGEGRCGDGDSGGAIVLASTILAAPVGMAIGFAVAPGERWTPQDPKRFGLAPTRTGGIGVRLSVGF